MNRSHWTEKLVWPITHKPLGLVNDQLVTSENAAYYSFENGIASFLKREERRKWDDYHFELYGTEPLTPHPYYVRFTDGWSTMLDMGCGDGTMSASSAHKVKDIYCLNPGYTALRVLQRRHLENMYPVNAFGEKMPFRNDFFDGIFNIFVIEHIMDPLPMLAEIRRVLKPTGRLVIATDTANFYKYLRPLFQWRQMGWRRGWRKWKPNDPTHINMMCPNDLRRYVTRAGFGIEEEHIHFFVQPYRRRLGWLPHCMWESWFSYMFVFVCKKL